MLSPKRTKFRKMQKGRVRGVAWRGSDVSFGDFALQSMEPGYITARQLEAGRMAIQRHVKRAVKEYLFNANIAGVEVERAANKAKVIVFTARPGMVIGKGGKGIEILKVGNLKTAAKGETKFPGVQAFTQNEVFIDVQEVRKAETNAQLVAENIATQLERRIAFRRAMKKALTTAMKFGAKGIRVRCAGRLGGSEMGRVDGYREGRVPLHTLRADIEYGTTEAHTTYGAIGVKCWIFKGEVLPQRNSRLA